MKIAIVGGGAAGLACAISALRKAEKLNTDAKVTVYEAKDRIGKKILATGNGRCNMFNTDKEPFYFSQNNFHSYALKKYDAVSHFEFFRTMGLYTRVDEEGRVYPLSNQATSVLDCLRNECKKLGVEFINDCKVSDVKLKNGRYIINSDRQFDVVVLACGGKAGVKEFNGYEILKQVGHKVTEINPSLSKLNTKDTKDVKQLQGIRHKVNLTLLKDGKFVAEEKGELLFAKYGISGIAVMQLSAFLTREKGRWTVNADYIPGLSPSFFRKAIIGIIRNNPSLECENLLLGFMPKKLGEVVLKACKIDITRKISTLSVGELDAIIKKAKKFSFEIESVRGFDDAQVTAGGADTCYFNPKTMESIINKNLYCIGEMLDVDGLCGGYNLMWAWSSGRLCGESLIK